MARRSELRGKFACFPAPWSGVAFLARFSVSLCLRASVVLSLYLYRPPHSTCFFHVEFLFSSIFRHEAGFAGSSDSFQKAVTDAQLRPFSFARQLIKVERVTTDAELPSFSKYFILSYRLKLEIMPVYVAVNHTLSQRSPRNLAWFIGFTQYNLKYFGLILTSIYVTQRDLT